MIEKKRMMIIREAKEEGFWDKRGRLTMEGL